MDSELYLALATDDIDVLKGKEWHQVRHQLTPADNTVLHIACRHGSIECVKEILQHADESLLLQINSRGETALHVAAREGYYHVVQALLYTVPQPSSLENRSSSTTFLQNLIRSPNVEFETALHLAVRNKFNDKKVVQLLVREDPSYSYPRNKFDETPLYLAAIEDSNDVAQIILYSCESPTFGGPHGRTALHGILMNSYDTYSVSSCTLLLLHKNPDLIKVGDVNGWTAFHYAAHNDLVRTLEFLLSIDKSVAYLTDKKYKRTPLHIAAYQGHCNILKELLKHLPDIWESADGNGQNIFHIAVKQEQKEVISYILSENWGSSLSIQRDSDGNTPLHLIAKYGFSFPELQKWVWKFDWNLMDHTNLTAAEVLYQRNKGTLTDEELVGVTPDRKKVSSYVIGWVLDEKPKQDAETPEEKIMRYRQMANSHMIVAALITTVALTAGFAMPGGFDGNQGANQGSAVLVKKTAFKTFIVADTFALLFSISSLFLYFLTSFKLRTEVVFKMLITAIVLNVVSIAAMMLAFIAGTYAVLSHLKVLAIIVCTISSIFLLLVSSFCCIPLRRLLTRMLKAMNVFLARYLLDQNASSPQWKEEVWNV